MAQHGFARVKSWRLGQTKIDTHAVSIDLHLNHDEETIQVWPYQFQLTLNLCLTEKTLEQSLMVENCDQHSFDFTALFHTYFNVTDIKSTKM